MARTYQDINKYLKGLHLTLDSCRPFRENEGWKMQGGGGLYLADIDGKWERTEEEDKPFLVRNVP